MSRKTKIQVNINAFLRRVALRIGDRVYTGRCNEEYVVEFDNDAGKDKVKEFLHKVFSNFDIFPVLNKHVSSANELKDAIGDIFRWIDGFVDDMFEKGISSSECKIEARTRGYSEISISVKIERNVGE